MTFKPEAKVQTFKRVFPSRSFEERTHFYWAMLLVDGCVGITILASAVIGTKAIHFPGPKMPISLDLVPQPSRQAAELCEPVGRRH